MAGNWGRPTPQGQSVIGGRCEIPETEIHHILSNSRRRNTLEYLTNNQGTISVRELSEAIAEVETGESPPPRDVRKTVYVSLLQTHLPVLDDYDIIEYDQSSKEVTLLERARDVRLYMEVVTKYGITWAEFYRYLGVLALLTVLAALIGVPILSSVAPLLWTSAFLLLFAVTTLYQIWQQRWALLGQLRS